MDEPRLQPDQAVVSEGVEDLVNHGATVVARLALLALPLVVRRFRSRLVAAVARAAATVPPLVQGAHGATAVQAEGDWEAARVE
eukprot:6054833-Alexandrium_andersonii.AAC.1